MATTKADLQKKYKELYGVEPASKMTIKQLTEAISAKEAENTKPDNKEIQAVPESQSHEGLLIWTTDLSKLEMVLNRRSKVILRGGKTKDVTEYFGIKKVKK